MVTRAALDKSGLLVPGSMVSYLTKAVVRAGMPVGAVVDAIQETNPTPGWKARTLSDASPGARRFIDRIAQFLTLVGLTALLIGGVGVSNAVRGYLDTKTQTIATLKCIGATRSGVFATYFAQIGILAGVGVAAGLVLGGSAPWWVDLFAGDVLPVRVVKTVFPGALLVATAFGLLTAVVFTLWPLARVNAVKPSSLFRSKAAPVAERPRGKLLLAIGVSVLALVTLAIATSSDRWLAASFVGVIAGTFVVLYGASKLVTWGAARIRGTRNPGLRLALGNLHRPGAATTSVMLSVGLGLTVLATIAMIERNLTYQIEQQLPARAPAFFFVDIQTDQVDAFEETLKGVGGVDRIDRVPMLRGRVMAINGVPSDEVEVPPDLRWIVESERGLTYAAKPSEGTELVEGEWWSEDYTGDPLISFGEEQARGLGLEIGDTLTVNVLGRDITGTIHNLRKIDFRSLSINFVIMFS
ncbi:MAG: FtsX-like permease family protein, partial [Myxococcota bacterium]